MVDHVPCYYWLARDKPVVRRGRTYPVTNLLNKLSLNFLGAFRADAADALVRSWLWSRWRRSSWSLLEDVQS